MEMSLFIVQSTVLFDFWCLKFFFYYLTQLNLNSSDVWYPAILVMPSIEKKYVRVLMKHIQNMRALNYLCDTDWLKNLVQSVLTSMMNQSN